MFKFSFFKNLRQYFGAVIFIYGILTLFVDFLSGQAQGIPKDNAPRIAKEIMRDHEDTQ